MKLLTWTTILLCSFPLVLSLDPKTKAAIIRKHNECRSNTGVKMPNMTWDRKLARFAQSHVNKWKESCSLNHSSKPERRNIPGWKGKQAGENMAGATSFSGPLQDAIFGVDSWCEEKKWYNIKTNICSAPDDEFCGHYTQMVWDTSVKIGCGYVKCSTGGFILSCNYQDGGNMRGDDGEVMRPFGRKEKRTKELTTDQNEEPFCIPSKRTHRRGKKITTITVTCPGTCKKTTTEIQEGKMKSMSSKQKCQGQAAKPMTGKTTKCRPGKRTHEEGSKVITTTTTCKGLCTTTKTEMREGGAHSMSQKTTCAPFSAETRKLRGVQERISRKAVMENSFPSVSIDSLL